MKIKIFLIIKSLLLLFLGYSLYQKIVNYYDNYLKFQLIDLVQSYNLKFVYFLLFLIEFLLLILISLDKKEKIRTSLLFLYSGLFVFYYTYLIINNACIECQFTFGAIKNNLLLNLISLSLLTGLYLYFSNERKPYHL